MERRTIALTLFGTVFAGGISAVIGITAIAPDSPYTDVLLWGGGAAILFGLAGLVYLLWTAPKNLARPSRSTTAMLSEGSEIEIEDSESTADEFIHATGASRATARRIVHRPKKGAKGD